MVIPTNGEESALQLWNLSSHTGPVYTFGGPLGTVLEAHWRKEMGEYQLVTWSQDHCLRIWRIEPFLQRLCGYIDADVQADSDSDAGPSNSGKLLKKKIKSSTSGFTFCRFSRR